MGRRVEGDEGIWTDMKDWEMKGTTEEMGERKKQTDWGT